jgi:hypothetical protein
MGASTSTMTLTAGTSGNVGTSNINMTAQNGFSGTVSLSCTVASTLLRTTCSVSPGSVTIAGSGSATLTVTAPTSRSSLRAPHLFPHLAPWTDGTFALAFGLVFLGKRDRTPKYGRLAVFGLLVLFAVGMMVGCGGGGSSSTTTTTTQTTTTTPSSVTGTGQVIVTATSGSFTRAVTINVTVN